MFAPDTCPGRVGGSPLGVMTRLVRRLVFGLGNAGATTVDKITVRWPDGATSEHGGLEVRRYHTLHAPTDD